MNEYCRRGLRTMPRPSSFDEELLCGGGESYAVAVLSGQDCLVRGVTTGRNAVASEVIT
jgi:hypothetical protein